VQMMVDGDAARALGELAAGRWRRATGERLVLPAGDADVWPSRFRPDLVDVDIGIARTEPRCDGQEEVREVEALFHDAIAAAQRTLYVENQFVTSVAVAERLARCLARNPRLEALIVTPQSYHSWIEAQTMRIGRLRFKRILADAGVADRGHLAYPSVEAQGRRGDTMVHSKVTIVDDRLLRVGSANLNNRSMGTDTECDLVVEAQTRAHREAITRIRNRLIADHCGVDEDAVATAIAQRGSLLAAATVLSGRGHSLREINDDGALTSDLAAPIEKLSDPPRPITAEGLIEEVIGEPPARLLPSLLRIGALLAVVGVLIVAWRFTALSEVADPGLIRERLASFDDISGGAIVIAAFVIAGLLGFPVTVLIAATAAAFGPWLGGGYAAIGAIFSAAAGYGVGTLLGRRTVATLLGRRLHAARRRILQQGVLAVAAIRLLPVAPFTLVNIACGVFGVRLRDFLAGTILGMGPGLVALAALGDRIYVLVAEPTPARLATVVLLLLAWLGLCAGIQRLLARGQAA
jgi:phospholipase D1/2